MRKLLIGLVISLSAIPAIAQHNHHHGHWHYRGGYNPWMWVGPTIIGGVIGYEISRSQQPVVVQQPVIVQQPAQVYGYNPNCSPWTEVQNADGTITRTRTCNQ